MGTRGGGTTCTTLTCSTYLEVKCDEEVEAVHSEVMRKERIGQLPRSYVLLKLMGDHPAREEEGARIKFHQVMTQWRRLLARPD